MHSQREDINLAPDHIQSLSSADRLAEFFARLRYPLDDRLEMTPGALQFNATLTNATRRVERLVSVEAGALQIYLFELTSVTVAHTRALARAFRNRAGNFLLVLTDDYRRIDFVLLERELPGLADNGLSQRSVLVRPRILSVDRLDPGRVDLRVLRRFTLTEFDADGRPDPYAQYDKLSSAYAVAEWSEPLFNNRALFSDYYLNERLPEHPAWEDENRNAVFRQVRGDFAQARRRFAGEAAATARQDLIRPLLETLDFRVEPGPGGAAEDFYLHTDDSDQVRAFVLAYPWNRYLDGKDASRDDERPEENPGARVVSLLDAGAAEWGIVTNGKLWRLYSARTHSRATNYYEINLEETLASPEPGEAFRYFYLFFRALALAPKDRPVAGKTRELTFLEWLMEESQAYARELGERLKDRVFEKIFPHFAEGFIEGMGGSETLLELSEDERESQLQIVYEGTLTFLYRLLFLLYAESRDLLPVREVRGYYQISLRRLKEEIAEQAGPLDDQVATRLEKSYDDHLQADGENILYDRLLDLFAVIDHGSTGRNVPVYNGGLFITNPDEDDTSREAQAARFLERSKLPDRYLALGLDRLARDVDPKRLDLGFIDYKSLGVRQLGSIYEGLLEFKVRIAAEEMAVVEGKRTEEVMPYAEAVSGGKKILSHGRGANASVRTFPRGAVYLENDRGERKATGSYYTPDYVVKYIVRHTVGPVLDEKLDALRPRLQDAERRFHTSIKRKREVEGVTPDEPALLQDIAADVLYDLFDVKILDPAMGSGHFLVEAVDCVTDRLVRFLEGFPLLGVFFERMRLSILQEMERQQVTVDPARLTDVTLLKRHVLKRCIYGVDLNPMAVELAKVSLWLDCFTLGAPLGFLDHHLRRGNSLIGAMAKEVEEEMEAATPEGQMTLLKGPFVGLLQATNLMQTLAGIADVTLEQVHESRTLFDDFEKKAKPYKQLLDVHVARQFGVERAEEFLSLYGVDAMDADPKGLEQPYREVVKRTRALYKEKRFFHWDLEFPEVFIDLDNTNWKENPGFDVVIGNPPYVSFGLGRTGKLSKDEEQFYRQAFKRSAEYKISTYALFMDQGLTRCRRGGYESLIVPDSFLSGMYFSKIREYLLKHSMVRYIVVFDHDFWESGDVGFPTIFVVEKSSEDQALEKDSNFCSVRISRLEDLTGDELKYVQQGQRVQLNNPRMRFQLLSKSAAEIINRMSEVGSELGQLLDMHHGIRSKVGRDEIVAEEKLGPKWKKAIVSSAEIHRHSITPEHHFIHVEPEILFSGGWDPNHIEQEKILIRRTGDSLISVVDKNGYYHTNALIYGVPTNDGQSWSLPALSSILNSRLMDFYYQKTTMKAGRTLPQVEIDTLNHLPIPHITFTTSAKARGQLAVKGRQLYDAYTTDGATSSFLVNVDNQLAREPKRADVIQDLLAHLSERLIEMNKQKQEHAESFWEDLEAVTDADTFDTLRNKGKWEQSLAKDPACKSYVDQESRSTRHLDESLGWDEGCFAAFAGILADKSSVTPPILDVYRRHHLAYKTLIERIAATDDLIDQIVYRLYGLTDEEIAVVEGEAE